MLYGLVPRGVYFCYIANADVSLSILLNKIINIQMKNQIRFQFRFIQVEKSLPEILTNDAPTFLESKLFLSQVSHFD